MTAGNRILAWITQVEPLPGQRPPTPGYPDNTLPGEGGEHPSNPIVIPPGAISPGYPSHPIFLPGGEHPDNTLPGQKPPKPPHKPKPPKPDNTLPGEGEKPDNELPEGERPVDPGYGVDEDGKPVYPSHPIVFPPGLPDNGLPETPGLPPLVPENPIVLPPGLPPGSYVVIPLYGAQLPTPKDAPPGTTPCLVWQGPGTLPSVMYMSPLPPQATPKAKE